MSGFSDRARLERRQPGDRTETFDRPAGVADAVLALQRSVGNAGVTRMLQRDEIPIEEEGTSTSGATGGGDSATQLDAPTGAGTGGGSATVDTVGGRRPPIRAITRNFTDCNAAVAWLNAGENAGDASPQYHPTPGRIRHTSQGGQFSVAVDLTWAYDPSSTADMIIPSWPNMTDAERAAVASYQSAIQAHEEMHFDITDNIIKALPRTVSATGSSQAAATRALQTAVNQYGAGAQHALDTATHDYDTTTQHGKNQAAVGGVNVHLDCSGGGTGGSGSSSSSTDASLAADLTGL